MNKELIRYYEEKRSIYCDSLEEVSRQIKRFAWYRFIFFLLIFVPVFVFTPQSWPTLIFTLLFLILFFFLVKKNLDSEKKKKKLRVLIQLIDDELLALKHAFSHFPNGKEFLDTDHFFSFDLDLFGEGSLFQFINRTVTFGGKKKLAKNILNPPIEKTEIEKRQEAIQELSSKPDWRLTFLSAGKLFEETEQSSNEINRWTKSDLVLEKNKTLKWLIKIIPILTLLSIIPSALGISDLFLIIMVFCQWGLTSAFWKTISNYYRFFGRKSELLAKYMQLLKIIEDHSFQSEYLIELQRKVKKPVSSVTLFKKLKSLVKEFEYRQNLLVGFFLNSILLWDLRCVYKLWEWHNLHYKDMAVWLEVLSETDAQMSLANFANNQSNFVYPAIHEGGFTFNAKQLGHPLLSPEKRICSDFVINGWSKAIIVTGANMAGKSTFLRTVGTNLILARLGVPVCAGQMTITPTDIYTNMRTSDSLLKDESYFFAELKRIKGVLDRLRNGERIFVILDEMLKGTNSIDKLNGSQKLIRKLLELKSVSLIATHDLKLSELENEFPQQVLNKCFEIKINNDEMLFDYKLTEGVTKTMNATFLMKKMGII